MCQIGVGEMGQRSNWKLEPVGLLGPGSLDGGVRTFRTLKKKKKKRTVP